jgi:hypothetical protein
MFFAMCVLPANGADVFNDKTRHPETGHWRPWTPKNVRSSGFAGPKDHPSARREKCEDEEDFSTGGHSQQFRHPTSTR